MDESNSGFILCDISFNGQLIADVKLPRACSMGNIVQGLWLDDNFRKTGLAYLKSKDEDEAQKSDGEASAPLKSFRGIDRCILRAYVAIRIMPAWKWLEFKDFIVDFENKKDCYTVGDVLGTLCTGLHKPVLRIVPKGENEADDQEVKNIVTELLKTRSLATLAAAECPFSSGMLSLIAQSKYTSTIGHDKCLAFIRWLRRENLTNGNIATPKQSVETPTLKALPAPTSERKPRLKPRITFSQNEIESLVQWFDADERPTREVMQHYTNILNVPREAASIRLLPLESIMFWFKNKRSKKRREETSLLEPWEKVEDAGALQTVSTPQIAMRSAENGNTPVSVEIVRSESGSEVAVPNGLATMLVRYSSQDSNTSKPRKIPKSRVTFDPETELSCLNTWFDDNDRPSKEVIEEYTNILNEARSGTKRRLFTSDSIAMWFKNRRSKRRRSETSVVLELENAELPMETEQNNALANDESQAGATSTVVLPTTFEVNTAVELAAATELTKVVNAVMPVIADESANSDVASIAGGTVAVTSSGHIVPENGSEADTVAVEAQQNVTSNASDNLLKIMECENKSKLIMMLNTH